MKFRYLSHHGAMKSVETCQSLCCSHTHGMDVDEEQNVGYISMGS